MSIPLLQTHSFKLHDKVRVLRKDEKDVWRVICYGIILKLGTTHAYIWEHQKRDGNTGRPDESSEWISYDSKMLKIVRD